MRHRVAGRKLGRTSSHRQALLRNLSTALIEKEKITTTLAKAKELRRFAEKLVTLSKRETLHARRRALRQIHDKKVVAKLFETISARYSQRPGGYTRIIKLGPRKGDNAEMAIIEFVGTETDVAAADKPTTAKGKRRKPAAKAEAKETKATSTTKKKTAKTSKSPARKRAKSKTTKTSAAKSSPSGPTKKKVSKAGRKSTSGKKG
jgi:large subunit ribosomal protein L17